MGNAPVTGNNCSALDSAMPTLIFALRPIPDIHVEAPCACRHPRSGLLSWTVPSWPLPRFLSMAWSAQTQSESFSRENEYP
jgi:hypothetical protein